MPACRLLQPGLCVAQRCARSPCARLLLGERLAETGHLLLELCHLCPGRTMQSRRSLPLRTLSERAPAVSTGCRMLFPKLDLLLTQPQDRRAESSPACKQKNRRRRTHLQSHDTRTLQVGFAIGKVSVPTGPTSSSGHDTSPAEASPARAGGLHALRPSADWARLSLHHPTHQEWMLAPSKPCATRGGGGRAHATSLDLLPRYLCLDPNYVGWPCRSSGALMIRGCFARALTRLTPPLPMIHER